VFSSKTQELLLQFINWVLQLPGVDNDGNDLVYSGNKVAGGTNVGEESYILAINLGSESTLPDSLDNRKISGLPISIENLVTDWL